MSGGKRFIGYPFDHMLAAFHDATDAASAVGAVRGLTGNRSGSTAIIATTTTTTPGPQAAGITHHSTISAG